MIRVVRRGKPLLGLAAHASRRTPTRAAKVSSAPAPAREGGISGVIRRAGEASGASAIARGIVGTVDAGIEKMVALAREEGIPERQIQKALRAHRKLERWQSMVALLLPFIPNPKLMRLLAKK